MSALFAQPKCIAPIGAAAPESGVLRDAGAREDCRIHADADAPSSLHSHEPIHEINPFFSKQPSEEGEIFLRGQEIDREREGRRREGKKGRVRSAGMFLIFSCFTKFN